MTYGRYMTAHKARNALIYVQDDDCLISDVEMLYNRFLSLPEGILCGATPERMAFEAEHQEIPRIALVGWGTFFRKADIDVFYRYRDKHGVDDILLREADRIFTYLQPVPAIVIPATVEHLDAVGGPALSAEVNHVASRDEAIERCQKLLGL